MARPTDYNEEILNKTIQYIDDCEDESEQQTVGMSAKGTELFKNKIIVNIPTVEGLAYELGVHKDTIYEWCKVHDEFSDAIERLKAKQGRELISKGLSGDYNPTIAKLLLSANHGMREKTDTDITSGGNKLAINVINFDEYNSPQQPKTE